MIARDFMSLPTEFAVCAALMARAVSDDLRVAEAAIEALRDLGWEECAAYLDTALATRRELAAEAAHSVKVAPPAVVLHDAIGRCECGATHTPREAFGMNRHALERLADYVGERTA